MQRVSRTQTAPILPETAWVSAALIAAALMVATLAPQRATAEPLAPQDLVAQAAVTPAPIVVENAYVRAVPPGQQNSAAFMTLSNQSERDVALLAGESPAAEVVELHTHSMDGGMMRMRRVDQIQVPAGQTVELKPGGLHVMLIGLTAPLSPGDTIDLSLGFDDGSQQALSVPVKRINPQSSGMHP